MNSPLRKRPEPARTLRGVSRRARKKDVAEERRKRRRDGKSVAAQRQCLHCDLALAPSQSMFCCTGCEAVYELIHREGFGRYYDLRDTPALAPLETSREFDAKWLEPLCAGLERETGLSRLTFDIQGLHCSACVWLIRSLFEKQEAAFHIEVNPALGRLSMIVGAAFPLRAFVHDLHALGYPIGPTFKTDTTTGSGMLTRIGVCSALAMNSMIFSFAMYAGLDAGPVFRLFRHLNFALAFLSVLVGGSVFLRSAVRSVRRGLVHLDLPIALGIALGFAGSTAAYLRNQDNGVYFDTLAVFITLMLVGRWLSGRVVERNRLWMLAHNGAEGLFTRRIQDGVVTVARCTELTRDDVLLIAPGDLIPVQARLEDDAALVSLDWINGESEPRSFDTHATLPAGAFNAGAQAFRATCLTDFEASPLLSLLGTKECADGKIPGAPTADGQASTSKWWDQLSRVYVVAVLVFAVCAFFVWAVVLNDVSRALDVTTALLIVTCPCAFGIAVPIAYELALSGLRRKGFFVRSPTFLDRSVQVRTIVFDKTGTLSNGLLSVENTRVLDALTAAERRTLYNLVCRSGHPKSVAVARALLALDLDASRFDCTFSPKEAPNKGVEATSGGHVYRIGNADWACAGGSSGDPGEVVFSVDGKPIVSLTLRESLRRDARDEVKTLQDEGYDVWILSGDNQAKVEWLADQVGVRADQAIGEQTPESKAHFVESHDAANLLVVGDGINDSLALRRAHCSGTPAVDMPFLASRADFYFTTAGLRPIRTALHVGRALRFVIRRNLAFALAYNAVTISLAFLGVMSPLLCAIAMPLSSISIVLLTVVSLSSKAAVWKS